MPIDKTRQVWLRALVQAKDSGNLAAFAERVKMDYTSLNLYYNGKRGISEKTVIRICNKLNIPPPVGVTRYAIESNPVAGVAEPRTVAPNETAELRTIVLAQTQLILDLSRRLTELAEIVGERLAPQSGQ